MRGLAVPPTTNTHEDSTKRGVQTLRLTGMKATESSDVLVLELKVQALNESPEDRQQPTRMGIKLSV